VAAIRSVATKSLPLNSRGSFTHRAQSNLRAVLRAFPKYRALTRRPPYALTETRIAVA
jgi:hypothetical protein